MNPEQQIKPTRRTDLDWLRVLAVLLLVPFHSALIFVLNPDSIMYVKDNVNSIFLDKFAEWIRHYHMPVFFYVSGASSYFALKKRSSKQYIKERFSKLLIPAIFGLALLIPPMTYLTLFAKGSLISYGEHFIHFWEIDSVDITGTNGKFTTAHLWFIIYLFSFSFLGLPLFLLMRSNKSIEFFKKMISKVSPIGIIFLFVIISSSAAKVNLIARFNPAYYFIIFSTGYLFMIDDRFQSVINKCAPFTFILGIVSELVIQFIFQNEQTHGGLNWIFFIIQQVNRWLWLLSILGFGYRFFNKRNDLLKYLSSASFPFYLFHLIINTVIGLFIIKLQLSIGIKYLIIVFLTILFTLFLYEVIKRIPFIRFLFGIKNDGEYRVTVLKTKPNLL